MTVSSTDSELDSGPRGRERERLCVATRTVRPVADLIRFVVSPDGEAVRQAGILDGFEFSREECEAIIMQARLKAGWVSEADLAPLPPAEEAPTTEAQP